MESKVAPAAAPSLPRLLSGLGLWMLVINGIVGAGIFGLAGEAARLAGGLSPWLFLACAALMLPVMLSFAELSSHYDASGGPVRYTSAVYGPVAGFLTGWALYIGRLTAFAANAVVLVGAVGYFWPDADAPGVRLALLFGVCAALTGVTVAGTRNAMGSLAVLTLLKFLPLVGLVAWGLVRLPGEMLSGLVPARPGHLECRGCAAARLLRLRRVRVGAGPGGRGATRAATCRARSRGRSRWSRSSTRRCSSCRSPCCPGSRRRIDRSSRSRPPWPARPGRH